MCTRRVLTNKWFRRVVEYVASRFFRLSLSLSPSLAPSHNISTLPLFLKLALVLKQGFHTCLLSSLSLSLSLSPTQQRTHILTYGALSYETPATLIKFSFRTGNQRERERKRE